MIFFSFPSSSLGMHKLNLFYDEQLTYEIPAIPKKSVGFLV
ncbi:hypothetical protein ACRCD7_00385 [Aliarcobacter sp. ERUVET-7]|nr:hypothetical protein [Aliarcobacter cryaerophilus]MCT7443973.1 hypothetical protein [Aliarcobacter cryaerophilus]MCT7473061.1 hypothetical protein [Aliarcobacter cryaerophilus]MCT7478539.1 hypothetical protein [Aliarcobacter cryaerophilus]